MASIYQKVGDNVKRLRRKQGITQEGLAEMAKTDFTTVSEVESGLRNPSLKTIHKLALALKVELIELFK